MKKLVLSLILSSTLLIGCAFSNPFQKPDAIIPPKTVHLDPRALESCKPSLSLLKDSAEFIDILVTTKDHVVVYEECRQKQEVSIKLLKEFSNYKEPTK